MYPRGILLVQNSQVYNSLITSHALIIIFFMVIPVLIGSFGNFMIPILCGTPDISIPRANSLRF